MWQELRLEWNLKGTSCRRRGCATSSSLMLQDALKKQLCAHKKLQGAPNKHLRQLWSAHIEESLFGDTYSTAKEVALGVCYYSIRIWPSDSSTGGRDSLLGRCVAAGLCAKVLSLVALLYCKCASNLYATKPRHLRVVAAIMEWSLISRCVVDFPVAGLTLVRDQKNEKVTKFTE